MAEATLGATTVTGMAWNNSVGSGGGIEVNSAAQGFACQSSHCKRARLTPIMTLVSFSNCRAHFNANTVRNLPANRLALCASGFAQLKSRIMRPLEPIKRPLDPSTSLLTFSYNGTR